MRLSVDGAAVEVDDGGTVLDAIEQNNTQTGGQ